MKLTIVPLGFCAYVRGLFFVMVLASVFSGVVAPAHAFDEDDGLGIIAGKPKLRILYTAGTHGELYPCPTCGGAALGGLARRLSIVRQFRSDTTVPVLLISGPDEILADTDLIRFKQTTNSSQGPDASYKPQQAKLLLKSFSALKVSAGYLSPEEANWLRATAGALPDNFYEINSKPVAKVIETSVGKVGLVFFPKGTEAFGVPSSRQLQEILEAGRELHAKTNLVFGISPWGSRVEESLVVQSAGIYACILGGGGGLGFPVSTSASTKNTLLIRSETLGRAINSLDIIEIPAINGTPDWLEGVSFTAKQVFLKKNVPADPVMLQITGENAIQ